MKESGSFLAAVKPEPAAPVWVGWLGTLARRIGRTDRVWLTLAALFAAIALVVPSQAVESLRFTADSFLWILPFLLLSVALAAWMKAAAADRLIGRTG